MLPLASSCDAQRTHPRPRDSFSEPSHLLTAGLYARCVAGRLVVATSRLLSLTAAGSEVFTSSDSSEQTSACRHSRSGRVIPIGIFGP
ncbi:hypothetical protein HPB50_001735 [Hyalomma asiaticum]|uniref:Uncharacterized protein n=1 Tax=Hyalomma asiaticum TaxID=266040 RepID=A0ACB7RRF8_HYAAI|nr:hypothetical protein HPB50_001735 [Hyalomma asiaticum]